MCFNSSIIKTNKNKTAIAPTQIIKKRKAKNSQPKTNKKLEEATKQMIKPRIDCMEFFKETTQYDAIKIKKEKKRNNNLINM